MLFFKYSSQLESVRTNSKEKHKEKIAHTCYAPKRRKLIFILPHQVRPNEKYFPSTKDNKRKTETNDN